MTCSVKEGSFRQQGSHQVGVLRCRGSWAWLLVALHTSKVCRYELSKRGVIVDIGIDWLTPSLN